MSKDTITPAEYETLANRDNYVLNKDGNYDYRPPVPEPKPESEPKPKPETQEQHQAPTRREVPDRPYMRPSPDQD